MSHCALKYSLLAAEAHQPAHCTHCPSALVLIGVDRPSVTVAKSCNQYKGKGMDIGTSLLREITCHMGSHSVTCHPVADFPALTPAKAGT